MEHRFCLFYLQSGSKRRMKRKEEPTDIEYVRVRVQERMSPTLYPQTWSERRTLCLEGLVGMSTGEMEGLTAVSAASRAQNDTNTSLSREPEQPVSDQDPFPSQIRGWFTTATNCSGDDHWWRDFGIDGVVSFGPITFVERIDHELGIDVDLTEGNGVYSCESGAMSHGGAPRGTPCGVGPVGSRSRADTSWRRIRDATTSVCSSCERCAVRSERNTEGLQNGIDWWLAGWLRVVSCTKRGDKKGRKDPVRPQLVIAAVW
ncbi:hypothetical protein B0T16DRAFT_389623 [Cercophora newfieldiana]|uniref:Uncharacterized protein n=1 Tax=Cercophora newfieldiana TaxID=92897 RepID=A0AA39YDP9_9PEZI|nr:hypothetical protein B0T16DRAFT_389623 [Cercophora newfieldiana]